MANSKEIKNIKRKQVERPSAALLDNWKVGMAIEVIEDWSKNGSIKLPLNEALAVLDLSQNSSFQDSLNTLIQSLKLELSTSQKTNFSANNLEEHRNNIEEYFLKNIKEKLQKVSQQIIVRSRATLRKLISLDCQQASPHKLRQYFQDLLKKLEEQKNHYEEMKSDYLKQETAANRAFFKLKNQLSSCEINSLEYLGIQESMCKAIVIYFESKFQVEINTIVSQIMLNQIQLCQSYYDSANRSLALLKQIKKSLEDKYSLKIISVPIFTHLKQVDPHYQKSLLGLWIGQSLNHWGNSTKSWQEIEAKLLDNIEPLALSFYRDFQHYFLEQATTRDDHLNSEFRYK